MTVAHVIDAMQTGYTDPGTAPYFNGHSFGFNGGYQNTNRLAQMTGVNSDLAVWSFTGVLPGVYKVAGTWNASNLSVLGSNNTTHQYRLGASGSWLTLSTGTNQRVFANQFNYGGVGWNYLGGELLITGGIIQVALPRYQPTTAGTYVVMDGMLLDLIRTLFKGQSRCNLGLGLGL